MTLDSLTRPELIFPELPGSDRAEVLRAFSDRLARLGIVKNAEGLCERLLEREGLGSTGIGSGVAIPHCKIEGLKRVILAVGTSREGIDYGAADGKPVKLFFLVVSPPDSPAEHLQSLAAVSRWLKGNRRVERILALGDAEAIFRALAEDSA